MSEALRNFLDIDYVKNHSTLASKFGVPFTNKFICQLNFNKASNISFEIQVLSVRCSNFELASEALELNGVRRYYFKGRNDGKLSITFLESPDLALRRFFYGWMQEAVNIDMQGVTRKYLSEVVAESIIVSPLDYKGDAYFSDIFSKVFPISIDEIDYDYSKAGEILKTTVSFEFMFHQIVDAKSLNNYKLP